MATQIYTPISTTSTDVTRVGTLVVSEAKFDSGGGTFIRAIATESEAAYVAGEHARTIQKAIEDGSEAWAATMHRASARAVYLGAWSLVDGATPYWRTQFFACPARKAFIFGEHSLPDRDFEDLQSGVVRVPTVSNAGHSMGSVNSAGLAAAIADATA